MTTTLSTFVASENGASPVISSYLRRALFAFKELRQHEKEPRASGSNRTSDWSKLEFLSEGDTVGVNSSQIQSIEVSQAPSHKPKKRLCAVLCCAGVFFFFFVDVFIIILMSYLYYFNQIAKNIAPLLLDVKR